MLPSSPPSAHSTRDAPLVTPNAAQEGARPSTIQNKNAAAAIDNAANTRAICANSASQPGPEQSVETPRATLPPPDTIANVVIHLLDGRTDAADIIAAVSDRLSITRQEHARTWRHTPRSSKNSKEDRKGRGSTPNTYAYVHAQPSNCVHNQTLPRLGEVPPRIRARGVIRARLP